MIYNREKFCEGYKKLDKTISQVNKKANNSQVKILVIDTRLDKVSRFITKASLNQAYMIELLSQKSQILLNKDSNTAVNFSDSEILIDEFVKL